MNPIAQHPMGARTHGHGRLKELARQTTWQAWLAVAVWHAILIGIERFTPAEIGSVAALDVLLELAATQAELSLLAPGRLNHRPLDARERAVVASAIAAVCAEFRHDEMLCGDDTSWTAPSFGWDLYADGVGYPMVAGTLC